jgi:hypothetical protein
MTGAIDHRRSRLLAAAAVDGSLDADEGAELEAHLATCPSCRADAAAMLRDHRWLASPGPVTPPDPRVLTAILRAAQATGRSATAPWASLLAAVLVVAIAGLGAVLWAAGPGAQQHAPIPTGGPSSVTELLANGWSVTASSAWAENQPSRALDGDLATTWGSGDYPPAWIEIDLGEPLTIMSAELVVEQTPPGAATHDLILMDASRIPIAVMTMQGQMKQFDVLSQAWAQPVTGVRYVRVSTTSSPSWVAWREIRIVTGEGS